jgi:hypothetical protein
MYFVIVYVIHRIYRLFNELKYKFLFKIMIEERI